MYVSADNVQYVYDSLNRLVEVHYPDKIIRYTYDAAGNRTSVSVENLVVAPSLSGLNPRGAVVGGNGFVLKINGANFTNNSVVQWNGANRPTTFVNANELRINLAASDLIAVGTASVIVVNSTPNAVSNSQTFSIVQNAAFRGRITHNGSGLSNVTLNLSGTETDSATTNSNGDFEFAVLNNGSYSLTPTRQNYIFNPATSNINYSGASQTNLDFTASLVSYTINGRVATQNGNGVSGVTMSLSGSQTGQATTDSNGNYVLTATAEGNYIITPALANYTFNPINQAFNNLSANQIANFTATQTTVPARKQFDFDGDGKTDYGIYRPTDGVWYLQNSTSGFNAVQFGISTDKLAPADFDGDGKTDIAVFRDGVWYLQRSTEGFTGIQFGAAGDLPRPADFDGDGKADLCVFRPSDGTWYRVNSSNNQFVAVQFGTNGDIPYPADFDGDSKADINVYRRSAGSWYRLNSFDGQFIGVQFGVAEDFPAPADYDGDGKADISVFRPSTGSWYRLNSSNGAFIGAQFGASGDLPTAGDYDGDGKADIAVWRPSDGVFYILRSQAGFTALQFGANGDKPVASAFAQ